VERYADQSLRLSGAYGGAGLPLTVLYDAKGNEIGRLLGSADWTSPEAKALVEAAIRGDRAG